MKKNFEVLLLESRKKVIAAINLVSASLDGLEVYDPGKSYSPKELEPYDALSDRFIRAIETSIKFFKTYEYYLFSENSISYRDLLLKMEKHSVISKVGIWVDMRDVRNRVVHEYLPDQVKDMYALIFGEFYSELRLVKQSILAINIV